MKPRVRGMPRRISSNAHASINDGPYPQSLPVKTEGGGCKQNMGVQGGVSGQWRKELPAAAGDLKQRERAQPEVFDADAVSDRFRGEYHFAP